MHTHPHPGGATYIPLHVVITDQTLSFFTQNTDIPKDWKVTLTTDLLWRKDTHIADHSPGANKDTQITDLKSHVPFSLMIESLGWKTQSYTFPHMCSTIIFPIHTLVLIYVKICHKNNLGLRCELGLLRVDVPMSLPRRFFKIGTQNIDIAIIKKVPF